MYNKIIYNFVINDLKNKFPFNEKTDCKEKYNETIQDFLYEEIINKM